MLTLDTMKRKAEMEARDETVTGVCLDAVIELQRAVGKFPNFPDTFAEMSIDRIRDALNAARLLNDSVAGYEATALSVISEEYCAFAEAVLLRDAEKARVELVQTIAMLLRTYIHLDEYCGSNKATGGDACPTGETNG